MSDLKPCPNGVPAKRFGRGIFGWYFTGCSAGPACCGWLTRGVSQADADNRWNDRRSPTPSEGK